MAKAKVPTNESPEPQKASKTRESVTLQVIQGIPTGPVAGFRRTFSRADHGDDFEAQAKAWAARFNAKEASAD